jgi:CheY-like chemotaxis protein
MRPVNRYPFGADDKVSPPMARTVLVVDDDPDAQALLSSVLRGAGYEPIFAADGPSGIAMGRRHRPAVIVMDLGLPGMSGFEAARQIKADPALAGIALVAHTLSTAPLTPEHDIFDAICRKPESPDVLIRAVQRAIRTAAARRVAGR